MSSKTFKSASILVFLAILGCKIATEDTTLTASSKKSDFKTAYVYASYAPCPQFVVFALNSTNPCGSSTVEPTQPPNQLSVIASSKYISTIENSELRISVEGLDVGESVHVVIPSLNWAGVDVVYGKPTIIDTIDLEKGLSAGQHIADGEYTFTTDKGGNGTIKIDNTPPVVEITSKSNTEIKANIYDPVVNSVSSGINDVGTTTFQENGYQITISHTSNGDTTADKGLKGNLVANISSGFAIASLGGYKNAVKEFIYEKYVKTGKDKVGHAVIDNDPLVFLGDCVSKPAGEYMLTSAYNFQQWDPDLLFVASINPSYYNTKGKPARYDNFKANALVKKGNDYTNIVNSSHNDDATFKTVSDNVKVTIDCTRYGQEHQELVVNDENSALSQVSNHGETPSENAIGNLKRTVSTGEIFFYDLLSKGFPIVSPIAPKRVTNELYNNPYPELINFSVGMDFDDTKDYKGNKIGGTDIYLKLTQPNSKTINSITDNRYKNRSVIAGASSTMNINFTKTENIKLKMSLLENVTQGNLNNNPPRLYKWKLECQ